MKNNEAKNKIQTIILLIKEYINTSLLLPKCHWYSIDRNYYGETPLTDPISNCKAMLFKFLLITVL